VRLGDDTLDQSSSRRRFDAGGGPVAPGLIEIFSGDRPLLKVIPTRGPLVIGRGDDCTLTIHDTRASRRHVQLSFDGNRWTVRDLGSRNGTFVDGCAITSTLSVENEALLAVGNTLFLLCADIAALRDGTIEVRDGIVLGPRLQPLWHAIEVLANSSRVLHLTGESGTGKELAARHFHASSKRAKGAFVAVNCAAVPPLLAERLFFGARRGAYSGADVDSDGYLAAADGGTLFLDEVGELSLDVQAKLLRAIETGEVMPLGAARPRTLDVAICSATHADLRSRVAAGSFREDLYFRLGQPALALPPLRARREEIPWIIEQTAKRVAGLSAHASFVEVALTRPWPGNARELINAVAAAANRAHGTDDRVKAAHLDQSAGVPMLVPGPASAATTAVPASDGDGDGDDVAAIREALERERGNVTRAAQALGMHRTQLRRVLARHGIDPREYRGRVGTVVDDSSDSQR
jgi:DNA-binding NtrC family response regulator